MRLNWFAPATAAAYSRQVLPLLGRRAAVTVWTERTGAEDPAPAGGPAVRPFHPGQVPWEDLNRADATVYHLGADPVRHGALADVAGRHPGIVVLHDPAAAVPARTLGVVVHGRELFERLRQEGRMPVLHVGLPPSGSWEEYANALLRFAGRAPELYGTLLAHELLRQVAAEAGRWTTPGAGRYWLPQAAREILALSGGKPLAA